MQILRSTYLSLGSNQGNKLENLQKAIDLIAENIGIVSKISSVIKLLHGVLKVKISSIVV